LHLGDGHFHNLAWGSPPAQTPGSVGAATDDEGHVDGCRRHVTQFVSSPCASVPVGVLDKSSQDLTPCLQQRMPDNNLEELLQSRPPPLDDVVAEAVGEDLTGQGRDGDAGGLALEDVAEVLEVGVAAADGALAQLEGRDVGAADNLVVGVHGAAHAVSSRIANLNL
jgi:hypothetical protein